MPGKENTIYCKACNLWKDENQFYKRSETKGGHQSYCKDCKKKTTEPKPELNNTTFEQLPIIAGDILNYTNVKQPRIINVKVNEKGKLEFCTKLLYRGKPISVSIKGLDV